MREYSLNMRINGSLCSRFLCFFISDSVFRLKGRPTSAYSSVPADLSSRIFRITRLTFSRS